MRQRRLIKYEWKERTWKPISIADRPANLSPILLQFLHLSRCEFFDFSLPDSEKTFVVNVRKS